MATSTKSKPSKKPAQKTPKSVIPQEAPAQPAEVHFKPALCIARAPEQGLWSLTTQERLVRQFAQAGLTEIVDESGAVTRNGPIILVRGDAVIDQPLIAELLRRPNFLLLSDDASEQAIAVSLRSADIALGLAVLNGGQPPSAARFLARSPSQLDMDFWQALRKRETPYAMIVTPENRAAVEWRMFMGTYKGATDIVTKHVWPTPAFHITRFLATRGVTPNMVTGLAAFMTALAFWLFLTGQFIPGLIAAWAMTFLDTVDGKLARTTLRSSKWGDIFDHGLDLIHPPFWYIAWALGLAAVGTQWSGGFFTLVVAAIIGGYVLQRLIEGIAIKWLGIEIHIWRPVDTLFRQVTARRNPNLVILTVFTLIAKPDWGLLAVAFWTVICLGLHAVQIIQAFAAKRKNGELASWMAKP
jgi:phosphatidylglycerophosphate synthase